MAKSDIILGLIAVGLVIVIIILAAGQKTGDIIVNEAQQRNTISVSDSYTLDIEPDQAELYIRVETKGKTALEAQQENNRISGNVIAALKSDGIKNEEIETVGYYLNPDYNWEEGRSEIVGYTQSHTIKVTTGRIDKVGTLLDDVVKAGANTIERISYTLSNDRRRDAMSDALEKAAGKAREKADSIAKTVGVKIVKVVTVSESNVAYTPYDYYPIVKAAGMAETAAPVMPQNVGVTAYISIIYEIG